MAIQPAWDEEFSYDSSIEILSDLASSHCHESGEVGRYVLELIRSRSFSTLCEYEPDYSGRLSASCLRDLRQALAYFQKLEPLEIGADKESVARTKFYRTEIECLKTNHIFRSWAHGEFQFTRDVEQILYVAQQKIALCLGSVPSLSELDFCFGPGATTSVRRRNACVRTKLTHVPSCSTDMLPLISEFLSEIPEYSRVHSLQDIEEHESWTVPIEIHDGKLSFVPKNAKTYRSIMVEPTCNTMLQGGIGRYLARMLLRVGQDVRDQSRNQRLARYGSLTGALATLDLSSASDSVSTELVAHLLPVDWYALLSMARTGVIRDGDTVVKLHKFSSMGNGFTFPLQTLIFWGLMEGVMEVHRRSDFFVSVYGDDIIIPTDMAKHALNILRVCGFSINAEKSYWVGAFRESCGKDYFDGFDIRPLYVKSLLTYADLFRIHNFYVRNYDFNRALDVLGFIPVGLRIFGPDGYGDGHLLRDGHLVPHRRDQGWAGFTFETYTRLGRRNRRPSPCDRSLPCYSIYAAGGKQESPTPHVKYRGEWVPVVSLPGSKGYKRIKVYTLQ